jgi:hypothetical protein
MFETICGAGRGAALVRRTRHCEPRGRANARPDDRLREAIHFTTCGDMDDFAFSASYGGPAVVVFLVTLRSAPLRASRRATRPPAGPRILRGSAQRLGAPLFSHLRMTAFPIQLSNSLRDIRPHSRGRICPSFALTPHPQNGRGRRESRVRAAPAVSCAMCTRKCAHEHTGPAEAIRLSLRDGFTAYFALSSVTGVLATVICGRLLPRNLAPAPGRQDHTTSPYAISHARQSQLSRPPHLDPRS